MKCSITTEKAAKPAHPTSADLGPPTIHAYNKDDNLTLKRIVPLADKTPPVKHPADTEFKMSCLARYYEKNV